MKNLFYSLILVLFTSCSSLNIFKPNSNQITNSEDAPFLTQRQEHVLVPDDKLSVSIWNHDDLSIGSIYSIYNTNESFGKWVLIEEDSTAAIPYTGDLKLGGLTLSQAEIEVAEQLAEFVKNPIVEMRVLNREVTFLGELNAPGNYTLEKEVNTLVEYIGQAEGLSFYADAKRVQLIRNEISYTIDLTHMDSFQQKNIYLQSRDIVYVPSKKGKKLDMKAPILIPFASLVTSVGVLISVLSK